ncbi:MAG TPA: SAM-dependent methyltransferase [Syntrophus sp. (in: bacteria)]|jgi:hypothetical protein|nr:SAM-dependent methyltransferase [Syntrophus sp. (in: bacteria)]
MDRREAGSSFRDPDGLVYTLDGALYRQLHAAALPHYRRLMDSGLYAALTGRGWLVEHREAGPEMRFDDRARLVLAPRPVPFPSYPHEWCFHQLKDAALLTLDIQEEALRRGMVLKDASAHNVLFDGPRPVFIDTGSFETLEADRPWAAYRQFCRHFLAPLALMAARDVRLGRLLQLHPDGLPLDLACRLLPRRTLLRPSLLLHLHAQSASQRRGAAWTGRSRGRRMGLSALLGLAGHLRGAVARLEPSRSGSAWSGYYGMRSYSDRAFADKRATVAAFMDRAGGRTCWDLGANEGVFSRLAAGRGMAVVAVDADPVVVDGHYLALRREGVEGVLPLVVDLLDPPPAGGWAGEERRPFLSRGPADLVLALALVHHLALGGNVPLPRIARLFAGIGRRLVVEFVPKEDPQVREMLAFRRDIFDGYTAEGFEAAFGACFRIEERAAVEGSTRTLYRMTALTA